MTQDESTPAKWKAYVTRHLPLDWRTLSSIHQSKLIKSSAIWLANVPIVARTLQYVPDELAVPVLDGVAIELDPRLPLAWRLLFFAAVFTVASQIVYAIRCPALLKRVEHFGDFERQGLTSQDLQRLWMKDHRDADQWGERRLAGSIKVAADRLRARLDSTEEPRREDTEYALRALEWAFGANGIAVGRAEMGASTGEVPSQLASTRDKRYKKLVEHLSLFDPEERRIPSKYGWHSPIATEDYEFEQQAGFVPDVPLTLADRFVDPISRLAVSYADSVHETMHGPGLRASFSRSQERLINARASSRWV